MLVIVIKCYFAKKLQFTFAQKCILYKAKRGAYMIEKLKVKAIYNDFISNVNLSNEQIKILNMMINKDSIVKISMEIGVSERTISYEIKKIKNLYNDYYKLQLSKILLLMD